MTRAQRNPRNEISVRTMARVIRSKNAGPFELTVDIIFKNRRFFDLARHSGRITRQRMARLYRIPVRDILDIIWFEPATALKVTMRRWQPSGADNERDIYGAQQHAPLLTLTFPRR